MAELLKEYKEIIIRYHEHDSLFDTVEEEIPTEEASSNSKYSTGSKNEMTNSSIRAPL